MIDELSASAGQMTDPSTLVIVQLSFYQCIFTLEEVCLRRYDIFLSGALDISGAVLDLDLFPHVADYFISQQNNRCSELFSQLEGPYGKVIHLLNGGRCQYDDFIVAMASIPCLIDILL